MKKLFSMLVLCICVLSAFCWADSKPGRLPDYTEYPIRATMWHDESTVVTGNALEHGVDSAHRYNSLTSQSAAANGNVFTNNFFLKAGSYTLSILGLAYLDKGMQDIYIDDVKQTATPLDWYSAGVLRNEVKTVSIVVVGNGKHVLRSVVNGKHASSSNYYLSLTKFWIK